MARFEFTGIDEYLEQLNQVGDRAKGLCKRALYDGAAVVADAVRAEVQALPTTDRDGSPQLPFEYEKQGLLEGLGVSKMKEKDGYIYTHIDFENLPCHHVTSPSTGKLLDPPGSLSEVTPQGVGDGGE